MSDTVIKLADRSANAAHSTVEDKLEEALHDLRGGQGVIARANKVLIIPLADQDDGYAHGFYQAGMSMSECIALVEIAKTMFLEQMGL
jgi:hypothetical protein